MIDERSAYEAALKQLRAGFTSDPQVCMDFLDGLGYYVGALGNEQILQMTADDILSEMDQEED